MVDSDTVTIKPHNPFAGLTQADVLVSSFPKTGSTFTRFVLANIVRQLAGKSEKVDFYSLGQIMPECRKDNLLHFPWPLKEVPRFVKSHDLKTANPLLELPRVLYILRDPRDTMLSFFYYASKRKHGRFQGTFVEFVQSDKFGMPAYNQHVDSWLSHADWVFTYHELMLAPNALFTELFRDLGVAVSQSVIQTAIDRSTPDKISKVEASQSRPRHEENFDKDFRFVRNASLDQWRRELEPAEASAVWAMASPAIRSQFPEGGNG